MPLHQCGDAYRRSRVGWRAYGRVKIKNLTWLEDVIFRVSGIIGLY